MRLKLLPLLAFFVASVSSSQTSTPVATDSGPKFEYLVVSFGKTLFSDASDKGSASKTLMYSSAGYQLGSEALLTQMQMDTLGRFGWELAGVVGAIGGDQELIFKRVYDPQRSAKEAKLIAQEAKAIAARKAEEAKKALAAVSTTSPDPIDLDVAEKVKAEADLRAKLTTALEGVGRKGLGEGVVVTRVESLVSDPESYMKLPHKFTITYTVDGTAKLLKGNTYRGSEAKQYAETVLSAAKANTGGWSTRGYSFEHNAFLNINVIVKYNGKEFPVGSASEEFLVSDQDLAGAPQG